MFPHLKRDREIRGLMDHMRQQATYRASSPATAAKPAQIRRVLKAVRHTNVYSTILVLWVSASRHGDLKTIVCRRWKQPGPAATVTYELQLGAFKSDRYGQRAVSKFIKLPLDVPLSRTHRWASYREVLGAMKRASPSLSVHSIRRGAITTLSEAFQPEVIARLTGHTPKADNASALYRYITKHPSHEIPRQQLEMSGSLLRLVRP
jgi:hypothetical protein